MHTWSGTSLDEGAPTGTPSSVAGGSGSAPVGAAASAAAAGDGAGAPASACRTAGGLEKLEEADGAAPSSAVVVEHSEGVAKHDDGSQRSSKSAAAAGAACAAARKGTLSWLGAAALAPDREGRMRLGVLEKLVNARDGGGERDLNRRAGALAEAGARPAGGSDLRLPDWASLAGAPTVESTAAGCAPASPSWEVEGWPSMPDAAAHPPWACAR